MKQGPFEIQLLYDGDLKLEEHKVNGETIAAAAPGEQFTLLIVIHRDQPGQDPTQHIQVQVVVDGVQLQSTIIRPGNEKESFRTTGFRVSESELARFKFQLPEAADSGRPTSAASNKAMGCIEVSFYVADISGTPSSGKWSSCALPFNGSSESKKFWEQVSVIAAPGEKIHNPISYFPYQIASATHITTIGLKYHTAETIAFLKEFWQKQEQRATLAAQLAAAWRDGQVVDLTGNPTAPAGGDVVEIADDGESEGQEGRRADAPVLDLTVDDAGHDGGGRCGSGGGREGKAGDRSNKRRRKNSAIGEGSAFGSGSAVKIEV